jgi:hypothetical protein
MNTYEIEPDGQSRFQVVERHPSGKGETVIGGFASVAMARDWINNRLRLMAPRSVSSRGWT